MTIVIHAIKYSVLGMAQEMKITVVYMTMFTVVLMQRYIRNLEMTKRKKKDIPQGYIKIKSFIVEVDGKEKSYDCTGIYVNISKERFKVLRNSK